MTIHIQTHQRKSKKYWGHACLCDPNFILDNNNRTSAPEKSNCPDCIKLAIRKLNKKIEILNETLKELE